MNRKDQRELPEGLLYQTGFVSPKDRLLILDYLRTIHPIWESRYAPNHPPPRGEIPRNLLRPVYWLGNWQFACLDYYRPPHGTDGRCVKAEPFPPVLIGLVQRVEGLVRRRFEARVIPKTWNLNTCLINLYGARIEGERRVDCARVGEHRDFEPGPVASISLGERAMFQFVSTSRVGHRDRVVFEQWLDDRSLQVFAGERWKQKFFHRVQRVDKRGGHQFEMPLRDFEVRRVNFTFRYVPEPHIVRYSELLKPSAEDVESYMKELAQNSAFFRAELARR